MLFATFGILCIFAAVLALIILLIAVEVFVYAWYYAMSHFGGDDINEIIEQSCDFGPRYLDDHK